MEKTLGYQNGFPPLPMGVGEAPLCPIRPNSPALERRASRGVVSACWLLARDDTDLPVPLHVRLVHLR